MAVCAVSTLPLEAVYKYEAEAPAHYEFEYSVHDTHTGDIKQQKESRAGDAVHGSYSLVQPDGVHRIVDYTSDKEHGFNAIVRYEGHPTEAPHVAKVLAPAHYQYAAAPVAKIAYAAPKIAYSAPVYSAPVAKVAYSSPIAYAAPVAKVAYAAPVAKIAYQSAPLAHVTFSSPAISYHH